MDRPKRLWAARHRAAVLLWCSLCVGVLAPAGCRSDTPTSSGKGIQPTPALKVEEARRLFSSAAREDLDPGRQDRSVPQGAREKYQRALDLLESINARQEAGLGDLLRTKLTLEALTAWRLGKFDKSESVRQRAIGTTPPSEPTSRDDFLLRALPGLIRSDQAFAAVSARRNGRPSDMSFEDLKALLVDPTDGAVKHISDARSDAEAQGHAAAGYLLMAELGAYRTLSEGYEQFGQSQRSFLSEFGGRIKALLDAMQGAGVPDSAQGRWRQLFPL
jgi:hypothetical protein